MPAGKPELGVTLTFPDNAGTSINGTLIDPDGQAVGAESTSRGDPTNPKATHALQAYHLNPRPGRWRFVVDVTNPVGGNALSTPYSGRVTFAAPTATTSGLPNSSSTVLPAGKAVKATIKVSNDGPASEDLFLDPRLPGKQDLLAAGDHARSEPGPAAVARRPAASVPDADADHHGVRGGPGHAAGHVRLGLRRSRI